MRMRWRPGPVVPFTFGLTDRTTGTVWFIVAIIAEDRIAISTDQPFPGHITPHIYTPHSELVIEETDLRLFMEDGRLCFETVPDGIAARRVLPYERKGMTMEAITFELERSD